MLRLLDSPAASYSPVWRPRSTIGAGGLNCRVRDGNGCFTSAIATENWLRFRFSEQRDFLDN
jgi:hypothetical protein